MYAFINDVVETVDVRTETPKTKSVHEGVYDGGNKNEKKGECAETVERKQFPSENGIKKKFESKTEKSKHGAKQCGQNQKENPRKTSSGNNPQQKILK